MMLRELNVIRAHVERLVHIVPSLPAPSRLLAHLQISRLLTAASLLLPDQDLERERRRMSGWIGVASCLS